MEHTAADVAVAPFPFLLATSQMQICGHPDAKAFCGFRHKLELSLILNSCSFFAAAYCIPDSLWTVFSWCPLVFFPLHSLAAGAIRGL